MDPAIFEDSLLVLCESKFWRFLRAFVCVCVCARASASGNILLLFIATFSENDYQIIAHFRDAKFSQILALHFL